MASVFRKFDIRKVRSENSEAGVQNVDSISQIGSISGISQIASTSTDGDVQPRETDTLNRLEAPRPKPILEEPPKTGRMGKRHSSVRGLKAFTNKIANTIGRRNSTRPGDARRQSSVKKPAGSPSTVNSPTNGKFSAGSPSFGLAGPGPAVSSTQSAAPVVGHRSSLPGDLTALADRLRFWKGSANSQPAAPSSPYTQKAGGQQITGEVREFLDEVNALPGAAVHHADLLSKITQGCANPSDAEIAVRRSTNLLLMEAHSVVKRIKEEEQHKLHELQVKQKAKELEASSVQAQFLKEITQLRDQLRKVPDGTDFALDVSYYEPLNGLDSSTQELVKSCVDAKIKEIICEGDIHQNTELAVRIRQQLTTERKTFEAKAAAEQALVEESAANATRELQELQERFDTEVKTLQDGLAAMKTELSALQESKHKGDDEIKKLKRELHNAREIARAPVEESIPQTPSAPEPRRPSELKTDLAAGGVDSPSASAKDEDHEGRSRASSYMESPKVIGTEQMRGNHRSLLPGSSTAMLFSQAQSIADEGDTPKQEDSDLHRVCERAWHQLNLEIEEEVKAVAPVELLDNVCFFLLRCRIDEQSREASAVRRHCISLYDAVMEVWEVLQTKGGNPAQKLNRIKKQVEQIVGASKCMLVDCFRCAYSGWKQLDEPRQAVRMWQHSSDSGFSKLKGQLTSVGAAVSDYTDTTVPSPKEQAGQAASLWRFSKTSTASQESGPAARPGSSSIASSRSGSHSPTKRMSNAKGGLGAASTPAAAAAKFKVELTGVETLPEQPEENALGSASDQGQTPTTQSKSSAFSSVLPASASGSAPSGGRPRSQGGVSGSQVEFDPADAEEATRSSTSQQASRKLEAKPAAKGVDPRRGSGLSGALVSAGRRSMNGTKK